MHSLLVVFTTDALNLNNFLDELKIKCNMNANYSR